jgi:hypothetical protein
MNAIARTISSDRLAIAQYAVYGKCIRLIPHAQGSSSPMTRFLEFIEIVPAASAETIDFEGQSPHGNS